MHLYARIGAMAWASQCGQMLDSSLAEGRGSGSVKWIMYLTAVKLVDSAQLQLVNLEVCRLNNQARQLS